MRIEASLKGLRRWRAAPRLSLGSSGNCGSNLSIRGEALRRVVTAAFFTDKRRFSSISGVIRRGRTPAGAAAPLAAPC